MLPESISTYLTGHSGIRIQSTQTVSGGSINQSGKISTNKGDFFLKWNASAPPDFFEKEAEGLRLLRLAESGLRIPDVIAVRTPEEGCPGFLLMEYIQEGREGDSFTFGAGLANLHMNGSDRFGLHHHNYIGSLPQKNNRHREWTGFFSEERIRPQIKMAVDSGKLAPETDKQWDRLAKHLVDMLPFADPSLLHGDLWSGNYLFDASGKAVLIDPAVYYGHPEMDLAFSKMFGGFSAAFYEGYQSVAPLEPGFEERVPVYNLYPLLVHANLFGGHYATQAAGFLKKFR